MVPPPFAPPWSPPELAPESEEVVEASEAEAEDVSDPALESAPDSEVELPTPPALALPDSAPPAVLELATAVEVAKDPPAPPAWLEDQALA